METVLNLLLIRFAIIAAGIALLGLVLFAVVLHLKRRGRWVQTRRRLEPMASRAADLYAQRLQRDGRSSWKSKAIDTAARRLRRGETDR